MGRSKNSGMVWRPIEYVLVCVALVLAVSLVWIIREISRQDVQVAQEPTSNQENDSDISNIVERGIAAEERIDTTYDTWEQSSNSVVDSAADDIGGIYNESAY